MTICRLTAYKGFCNRVMAAIQAIGVRPNYTVYSAKIIYLKKKKERNYSVYLQLQI